MCNMRIFVVKLRSETDDVIGLRRMLKAASRLHRLTCLGVTEWKQPETVTRVPAPPPPKTKPVKTTGL